MSEKTDNLRDLDEYVVDAVTNLFQEWGYGPCRFRTSATPEELGDTVVAIIGFSSETARGSLALMMRPEVAITLSSPESVGPGDVVAELCNMLLGRLKNKLLARGVVLQMALPTVATGLDVRVLQNAAGRSVLHEVGTRAGLVVVRLEAAFEPGFALSSQDAANASEIGREGDCLLF